MQLSWSGRRRVIYAVTITTLSVIVIVFVWLKFFNAPPTCFDNTQNGTEQGIDCGGTCSLLCQDLASAPRVKWSRGFQNGAPNIYTLAAYIENSNPSAGVKNAQYIFQVYDTNNKLVVEKKGVVSLPPVQTVPIVEPMVDVGNRTVAHVEFSFNGSVPLVWQQVDSASVPALRVARQQLSGDGMRLDATIENNSIFDAPNVTLIAILYDTEGVARAASKSVVPTIAHKGSENVTFTWPTAAFNIARTEITILPSF